MMRAMSRLRNLLGVLLLLLGCLAVAGQAVAGAAAGYSDCCLQGCEGMAHCTQAACQACAAPLVGPAPATPAAAACGATPLPQATPALGHGPMHEPWTPPD